MVCVVRVVGGPFYSLRGRFPPSPYKTSQTAFRRIRSAFPPKFIVFGCQVGPADPSVPPLATALLWYTAWWVLMSDGWCRGLVGRFGLVCGPPLLVLSRMRSSVSSVRICRVFVLFRTCAPEIMNLRKQLWS